MTRCYTEVQVIRDIIAKFVWPDLLLGMAETVVFNPLWDSSGSLVEALPNLLYTADGAELLHWVAFFTSFTIKRVIFIFICSSYNEDCSSSLPLNEFVGEFGQFCVSSSSFWNLSSLDDPTFQDRAVARQLASNNISSLPSLVVEGTLAS